MMDSNPSTTDSAGPATRLPLATKIIVGLLVAAALAGLGAFLVR